MVTQLDALSVYAYGDGLSSINCLPEENFKTAGMQQCSCYEPVPLGTWMDTVGQVLQEGGGIKCMEHIDKGNGEFCAYFRICLAKAFQPCTVCTVSHRRRADEQDVP